MVVEQKLCNVSLIKLLNEFMIFYIIRQSVKCALYIVQRLQGCILTFGVLYKLYIVQYTFAVSFSEQGTSCSECVTVQKGG